MQIFRSLKEQILDSRAYVQKHQRFIPVFAFFAGFTWDNITITRIDEFSDNMIIGLYLVLLGALIILSVYNDKELLYKPVLLKYRHWIPSGIQFFLGGLFSVYVVFYFKSASFTKTALFLGLLVLLFIANEFLGKKLNNTYLLFSLYFMAAFSFFIFFIPVAIGVMNLFTFILGSLAGLILPLIILYFLNKKNLFASKKIYTRHIYLVTGLFLILNLFYWMNWIPPVPLAMKYAGIYHHVDKNHAHNTYSLTYEKPVWYQFFKDDDSDFNYQEGDTVFCFASVFAPTRLTKQIAHQWQYYSEDKGEWIGTDRTTYQLTGGREGGYRGYTFKKNVKPGSWRVDIITDDDLILGRIKFKILPMELAKPEFITIIK